MSQTPQISDAEWRVMKVIWSNTYCTANQVVEVLAGTTDWQPNTIKTLINRLVNKGALGYRLDDNDKKTYHYFAQIDEKECVLAESQTFLKRVFGGSASILLANFIKEFTLSQKEIDDLKKILEDKKE